MIPTLQYYKYLYAIRLIDYGFANEALHYLEEVAAHIVKRPGKYIDANISDDAPNIIMEPC